jgi:hypothetical protein
MKIKGRTMLPGPPAWIRRLWRDRRVVAVLLYTGLVFVAGAAVYRTRVVQRSLSRITYQARLLPRMASARLSKPDEITIDIKHDDYLRLVAKREEALRRGILISTADDFVPATIRHKDQTIRVRLRLKGDLADHWDTDRWSFRVVVRDDQTLFGMRQFSLQHPKTRFYLNEWVYHQALRREGLIDLRFDYLDVTINGKRVGVYAMEEFFEDELVANNQRPSGPIIRFSEDLFWQELLHYRFARGRSGAGSYLASVVDGFRTQEWLADSTLALQYFEAARLLEGFRRGELRARDVFDVDATGRFAALNDLIGTEHGSNWRNIRYYFNPVTTRLEPIGFDALGGNPLVQLAVSRAGNVWLPRFADYRERLYQDPDIQRAYLAAIERMGDPSYLRTFLDSIMPGLEQRMRIIRRNNPEYTFSPAVFLGNAQYMRRILRPVKRVHGWVRGVTGDSIDIEVGNIQGMPLQVIGLNVAGRLSPLPVPLDLDGRADSALVRYRRLRFAIPGDVARTDSLTRQLHVVTVVPGTRAEMQDTVFTDARTTGAEAAVDAPIVAPNIHQLPFARVDEANRTIRLVRGTWDIRTDVVVPAGYRLRAGPGVRLRLSGSANFVSYSPVEFAGAEDDPVFVESDSTGGGFVVLRAGAESFLRNVVFRNLGNPTQEGWTLTGAVTFFESPVAVVDCVFEKNEAEDALQVMRTSFHVEGSTFLDAVGNALAIDVSTGTVENSRFARTANNAIAVTGSSARITGVKVDGAGGKGVSVSEHSTAYIADTEIRHAHLGVASRDLSHATLMDVVIADSRFGLGAYRRNAEFGGSDLRAIRATLRDVQTEFLRDIGSRIVLNSNTRGTPLTNARELADTSN